MKFLISAVVVSFVIASCWAEYTPKQQELLSGVIGQCSTETKVSLGSDFLERTKSSENPFPADKDTTAFVVCFLTKTGVLLADGTIATQPFIDFFAEGHDVAALTEVTEICAKIGGATREQTAYNFNKCFWDEKKFLL